MYFLDRVDAGRQLAQALADLSGRSNVLVLGIPRGGVVVAYHVAVALAAELDVCLTHKLGAPDNPELAIGAVAEDGTTVLDEQLIRMLYISDEYVQAEAGRQRAELARRARLYRGDRPSPAVHQRTVIVVDDGVATGATMAASLQTLTARQPATLVAAVPVASPEAIERLRAAANRTVCLLTPKFFWAVGAFYSNFAQVSDQEVITLLNERRTRK